MSRIFHLVFSDYEELKPWEDKEKRKNQEGRNTTQQNSFGT